MVEPQETDESTGHAVEKPDGSGLGPEEVAMAREAIDALPANYRRAFLLRRAGFAYESENPDESMAVMLGKTPKTAKVGVTLLA